MADPAVTTEEQPFIEYADTESAPEFLRPLLDRYIERMGFLPNALRFYLHRPEMYNTIHDGLKVPIEAELREASLKTGL